MHCNASLLRPVPNRLKAPFLGVRIAYESKPVPPWLAHCHENLSCLGLSPILCHGINPFLWGIAQCRQRLLVALSGSWVLKSNAQYSIDKFAARLASKTLGCPNRLVDKDRSGAVLTLNA